MSDNPPIDYFHGWPPIETHADAEWEEIARGVIANSGVPDGDVDAMTLALKSSAAREQAYRAEIIAGWAAIEAEAHTANEEREDESA